MHKKIFTLLFLFFSVCLTFGKTIEKTYYFDNYSVTQVGEYQSISFENTLLTGLTGEPALPYCAVSLLLEAGEVAENIEIIGEDETLIPGTFLLYPQQYVQPVSKGNSGLFAKNEQVYASKGIYPQSQTSRLSTSYMNGYSFAFSTFTPVRYNPSKGEVSYYKKVTIRISSKKDGKANLALANLSSKPTVLERVKMLAQNTEAIASYPVKKSNPTDYEMLIITGTAFQNNFTNLINIYKPRGIRVQVVTVQSITSSTAGRDAQEKIRNYITQQYQQHSVDYVLLGGDVELVPYRGFFAHVQSSSAYEDNDIPSDLYYSALDGTWNTNNNTSWGEIGEDDLLPEIAVGRMPFSTASELTNMLNKSIGYQNNPVIADLNKPLLAGENLYDNPSTWGDDYLDLLVGHHTDNGYTTDGIPTASPYQTLYDTPSYTWSASTLTQKINAGTAFVHHVGHANESTVMKYYTSDITDANFAQTNGTTHTFTLVYTHGCICGAFDVNDCIAEYMLRIQKFAAAFVGNSRYGWFNEGQTEGPSAHLHREFVNSLYGLREAHLGMAHAISKMATAPWVNAPGQWEQGAIRWCFYDCNALGDPALNIWTAQPQTLVVNYQNALPIGVPVFTAQVSNNSGVAQSNMTFTIMKNDVIYGIGKTDAAGNVSIELNPAFTETGDAQVIISGYNVTPQTLPLTIIPNTGSYIVLDSYQFSDGNNNQPEYGETIQMNITLKNVGQATSQGIVANISTTDTYVTLANVPVSFGTIEGGQSVTMSGVFPVQIANNVPDNHLAMFSLSIADNASQSWASNFSMNILAPKLKLEFTSINDASGNNNGRLDPGETVTFTVTATNEGHASANLTTCSVSTDCSDITLNDNNINVGNIAALSTSSIQFSVTISPTAAIGSFASFDFLLSAGEYEATLNVGKKIGLIVEDFESSNFNSFQWEMGGNSNWTIASSGAYEGSKAAKSGTIGSSQSTQLSLDCYIFFDDVIGFYKKVSSESGYDYLKFYIDGVEMEKWAGEVAWSYSEFPISAGNHTIKWEYMKDGSATGGSDCAWLDYILLPSMDLTNDNPPVITSVPILIANENELYNYTITTTDADVNDVISITCPIKPIWLTFVDNQNGTATLSGTPTLANIGMHNVKIIVTDGKIPVTQEFTVGVGLNLENWESGNFTQYSWEFAGNTNWTITNTGAYEGSFAAKSGTITHNQSTVFKISADVLFDGYVSFYKKVSSEINRDYLKFYIDNVEQGNWSGTVAWSNSTFAVTAGTHEFRWVYSKDVSMSSGSDAAWVDYIILPIFNTGINFPPEFLSQPITQVTESEIYTYQIVAQDANNDALTVTCSVLPSWLTFAANANGTATLNGIPANANVGNNAVTISVSDGVNTVNQEFTINVIEMNVAPQFTSTPLTEATEILPYNYELSGSDANTGDILEFKLITNPGWLNLVDNHNNTASLTGVATQDNIGENQVSIELSDGVHIVNQDFIINVAQRNYAPEFVSTPVDSATKGTEYVYVISVSDANASDIISFELTQAPTWLTLTKTGNYTAELRGTPTAENIGTQQVTITINDGHKSRGVVQTFNITVKPATGIDNNLSKNNALEISPNIVSAKATVTYTILKQETISISIFDNLGNEVVTVLKNQSKTAGTYNVDLDAMRLQSGIYFVKMDTENGVVSKRFVVVK